MSIHFGDIVLVVLVGCIVASISSFLLALLMRSRIGTQLKVAGRTIELTSARLDELKQILLSQMQSPQVFIAHSYRNMDYARRLANDLKKEGLRIWVAGEQIRPGDKIARKVGAALRTSGYFLMLVSRESLKSAAVRKELQMALSREKRGIWPRVIPVLIDHVPVPPEIAEKLYIDLTKEYELGVKDIVSAIKELHLSNTDAEGTSAA